MHKSRLGTIVIDCQTKSLDAAARFWGEALGRAAASLSDPAARNYRKLEDEAAEVNILVLITVVVIFVAVLVAFGMP